MEEFSKWVLAVGDGGAYEKRSNSTTCEDKIKIPDDLLIKTDDDKMSAIIHAVYGDMQTKFCDPQ